MAQIEIAMTVSGSTYYISDSDYASPDGNFYQGLVSQAPIVSLGATSGGYISVQKGTVILNNDPDNASGPFGSTRYATLLATPGPYDCTIKYDTKYPMFSGTVVLEEISNDQLRFSFQPTSYSNQAISVVTDSDGNSQYNPFSHGVVTNRQPLIQTGSQAFRNPSLNTSETVTVFEEGTNRFSSDTSTTITTSGYNGGQVVVSGTGANGTTVETFFDYVANTLSLGVTTAETTKTSSASSRAIHLYSNKPQLLTELASEVARSVNHQFYILPNPTTGSTTLYLIDRANLPTATQLSDHDVVGSSYTLGFPIQAVEGTWKATQRKGSQLQTLDITARSENVSVGQVLSIPMLADTVAQVSNMTTILNETRDVEKKPQASITVSEIKTDYYPGDRFKLDRSEDQITIDMIARTITWDFNNKTTNIKGDATLSELVTQ